MDVSVLPSAALIRKTKTKRQRAQDRASYRCFSPVWAVYRYLCVIPLFRGIAVSCQQAYLRGEGARIGFSYVDLSSAANQWP